MITYCGHPITAAIFDMDGTILDSSAMWASLVETVVKRLGYEPKSTLYTDTFPLSAEEIAAFLKKDYGMKESVGEIYGGMTAILEKYYFEDAQLKPGAGELIEALDREGVRLALASATSERYVVPAMELTGLKSCFDYIATADKLGTDKGDPAYFHRVLEVLGAEPGQTVLFEDALYSVTTARNMGILTCGVYDVGSSFEGNELKDVTDCYLSDLADWRELPVAGWKFPPR